VANSDMASQSTTHIVNPFLKQAPPFHKARNTRLTVTLGVWAFSDEYSDPVWKIY